VAGDLNAISSLVAAGIASPFHWWDPVTKKTPLHYCAGVNESLSSSLSTIMLNIVLFPHITEHSDWCRQRKKNALLRIGRMLPVGLLQLQDRRGYTPEAIALKCGNNTFRQQLLLRSARSIGKVEPFQPDPTKALPFARSAGVLGGPDISNGQEPVTIPWVNAVDDQLPPYNNDTYITTTVQHTSTAVDWSTLVGGHIKACGCSSGHLGQETAGNSGGGSFNNIQHTHKPLLVARNNIHYACHHRCACSSNGTLDHHTNCPRALVQKGVRHALQLFRADDQRGWGVRALAVIPKHSFVSEYCGELVADTGVTTSSSSITSTSTTIASSSSLITRVLNKEYMSNANYGMDLDSHKRNYSLDGSRIRNVSAMFNHQCRGANLFLARVQVYHRDKEMWKMCFFAAKDIRVGDELTFNYGKTGGFFGQIGCLCAPCKKKRAGAKKKGGKKKGW